MKALLVHAVVVAVGIGCWLAAGPAEATLRPDVGACPAASKAALLPRWPYGGLLRGDLDGDGHSDAVSIRYAAAASTRCGFLLVVKTRSRVWSLPIVETYKDLDLPVREWSEAEPVIKAIVDLGGSGAQIVVATSHGAANQNVALVGIVRGRLSILPVGDRADLSLGGTVGVGVTRVRCRRGGPMSVLGVWPTSASGRRVGFSTSNYRLRGDRFVFTGTQTVFGSPATIDRLAAKAGFNRQQFAGCTLARTGRFY